MVAAGSGRHCPAAGGVRVRAGNAHMFHAYRPIFVRRQWRRFELYRILLFVRMRIHCGIGRFCFSFFASVILVRKLLLAGISRGCGRRGEGERV